MASRDGSGQSGGGGFKFDDEAEPPKKKQPKFEFSVEEVKEEDTKRRARVKEPSRVKAALPPDPATLHVAVPVTGDAGRFEWPMVGIVLLLLPLVYWLQTWTRGLHNETLEDAPAEVLANEEVREPGITELAIMSKLSVKFAFVMEQHGDRPQNQTMSQMEEEAKKNRKDSWRRGPVPPPEPPPQASDEDIVSVEDLESVAWTRIDRLRVAIVAGELDGPQAALERLDTLLKETDASSELATEIAWLVTLYREGPDALPYEAAESLRARHGWFGRLAMSFARHPSDNARWDVVSGGERFIIGQVLLIVALVLTSLAGLLAGVMLVVKYRRTGYLVRFIPPEPGGSVYIETFGVFLGGFALLLLMELFFFGLRAEGTITAAAFQQVLLWSLVLTAAWPLVRGVAWRDLLRDLGWHKGEGYSREVLAGCVGFLGAQPAGWIGGRIGQLVETATNSGEPEPSFGYGLFEIPTEATGLLFVLGIVSAVVWAPVVEETIFRGALFRHLTGRMSMIWAAAVSALCFGLIHPYTPAGLIEVAAGGFMYALIRAWRGSLIAPMVAHALHNTVASSLEVYIVTMLGD